jgi:hypothetical protein
MKNEGENAIGLSQEEWTDIAGTDSIVYKISNMGRVMSVKDGVERILTPYWSKGQLMCSCSGTEKKLVITVAYAVAKAFVPNPRGRRKLIFLDGDRSNCQASNLQWEQAIVIMCRVPGCEARVTKYVKDGLCTRHWQQLKNHGRIVDGDALLDLPGEQWADLVSKEGTTYKISNMGRVMSLTIDTKRILSPIEKGAYSVCFINALKTQIRIANAVARAFVPNPYGDKKIVSLDGDTKNCQASNLEWFSVLCYEKNLATLRREIEDSDPYAKGIVAFMEGDSEAMNEIIVEQRPRLLRWINYLLSFYPVSPMVDAEGIVQESLISAVIAIRRGQCRTAKAFSGWLNVIGKRMLQNAWRATNSRPKETAMIDDLGDRGSEFDWSDTAAYENWSIVEMQVA